MISTGIMSAATSAERLMALDRLMPKSWISVAVISLDKLIDASWGAVKEPVIDVVETVAFSSLGQFTIGCLETGVSITASALDVMLPISEKETGNEVIATEYQEGKAKKKSPPLATESKKKTKSKNRNRGVHPIRTVLSSAKGGLRNVQKWLHTLKIDGHGVCEDICKQCSKRRKVVAPRRLGLFHGLVHLSFDAFTAPMRLIGFDVSSDVLKCVFTLSENDELNKSPVRPKSASEKRRFTALSSSDEEVDDIHRFHDDLGDYKSEEDEDYEPEVAEEAYDSDEYGYGETESDVSLEESPAPLKPREAKIAAQRIARKAAEDVPDGLVVKPTSKKNDKRQQKKDADQNQEAKKTPKKSGNKDGKTSSDKENKEEKSGNKDFKTSDKENKEVKSGNKDGKTNDAQSMKGSETTINGHTDKDVTKGSTGVKTGKSVIEKKGPVSPLRKLLGGN